MKKKQHTMIYIYGKLSHAFSNLQRICQLKKFGGYKKYIDKSPEIVHQHAHKYSTWTYLSPTKISPNKKKPLISHRLPLAAGDPSPYMSWFV